MRRERHYYINARHLAGACISFTVGAVLVLKYWARSGAPRIAAASLAAVSAILAAALFRFMIKGNLKQSFLLSLAAAAVGLAVWAAFNFA